MTQKYDKEFKINAVKVYLSSERSIQQIAMDLGIARASLGKWIKDYKEKGEKSFPGSGYPSDPEVQALKRELHLVKQERDILKKAVAIFSDPRKKGTI